MRLDKSAGLSPLHVVTRAAIDAEENGTGALLQLVGWLVALPSERRGQQPLGARGLRHILGWECESALPAVAKAACGEGGGRRGFGLFEGGDGARTE